MPREVSVRRDPPLQERPGGKEVEDGGRCGRRGRCGKR